MEAYYTGEACSECIPEAGMIKHAYIHIGKCNIGVSPGEVPQVAL